MGGLPRRAMGKPTGGRSGRAQAAARTGRTARSVRASQRRDRPAQQHAARRHTLLAVALAMALLPCLLLVWPVSGHAGAQLVSAASAHGAAPSGGFQLPADPGAEILRWHTTGGMGPASAAPALLLRAGGDFEARPVLDASGKAGRARRGHLAPAALQALLTELLVQHRLASLSGPAVRTEIEAIAQRTGRLFKVMDGGESTITISLPGVQHQVSLPAPHAAQRLFPEVDDLRHFNAIQQRLLRLADTAR